MLLPALVCLTLHSIVQEWVKIYATKLQARSVKLLKNFQHFKAETKITDTYKDVINQLVSHRHRQKLTQEELAHKIGCTKSLIHKWEQYKRVPSGFLFTCWLDALGLTLKVHKKKTIR